MSAANTSHDPMSPDYQPEQAQKSGVKRLNNVPALIALGLMAAFLAIMAYVAQDRAARQSQPRKDVVEKGTGSGAAYAQSLVSMAPQGVISAAQTTPAEPPTPKMPPETAVAAATAAQSPGAGRPIAPALEMDSERLALAKKAMMAQSNLDVMKGESAKRQEMLAQINATQQAASGITAASLSTNPTTEFKRQLAQIQGQGMGQETKQSRAGRDVSQFGGDSSRWDMPTVREAARTPFTLRAGFVIPAVLVSGINSELPGQIIGQVARNIYSPPYFQHLLIPQGSRLVGTYSSDVQYGQSRVLVAWQRIIYPDGRAQDIGSMPGTDSAGYAGFNDKVNNHYLRIFGSAVLLSGITAGISYSQAPKNDDTGTGSNRQTANDVLSQSLGQVLGQTASQMIQKNMNISPTLEIRPGYQFNVTVTKDMAFDSPYLLSH